RAIAGRGVEGTVHTDRGERHVAVGTTQFLVDAGVALGRLAKQIAAAAQSGAGIAAVAVDREPAGLLTLRDAVKPTSAAAVAEALGGGLDVWLVSGDSRSVAESIASEVSIARDRVIADVLPGDKAAHVARLRETGRVVAMVGDGINDAPALATADLGIAIGSGADVAIEAADVTLVGGDPRAVMVPLRLSRATMRIVRQNLAWAFGYNIVLIPVAMGVLYPFFGLLLNPGLAAGAMALSSVSVVLNSLRLRSAPIRPAG